MIGGEWFWRVEVDDLRSELPVVIVSDFIGVWVIFWKVGEK